MLFIPHIMVKASYKLFKVALNIALSFCLETRSSTNHIAFFTHHFVCHACQIRLFTMHSFLDRALSIQPQYPYSVLTAVTCCILVKSATELQALPITNHMVINLSTT